MPMPVPEMRYAAVLAGGQSSRMGQDKRALMLHGETLLERAIKLLQAAGADTVLLSGTDAAALVSSQLSASCAYRSVPDLFAHSGPPGGLFSLLAYLHQNAGLDGSPLLLIPVDMPLLTAATLRVLLDACIGKGWCHYEGEVFPCVVSATPAMYQHLRELFSDGAAPGGKRSMKAIMKFAGATSLPIPAGTAAEFRNANTPEDWQAIVTSAAGVAL